MAKLSKTQQAVVDQLRATGGPLVRSAGGFWSYAGCAVNGLGWPTWSVTSQTVEAMTTHGVLKRTGRYPDPRDAWRDDRVLTGEYV